MPWFSDTVVGVSDSAGIPSPETEAIEIRLNLAELTNRSTEIDISNVLFRHCPTPVLRSSTATEGG